LNGDGRVGVGFIGAGSCLGEYLVVLDRLIAAGSATEGPICARRREAWPALLARRPDARLVTDASEVVDSDVGVVVVITRDDSHAGYVRLALEHGKHAIVERPIAMSLDEATELAELARSKGLHLVSGPVVHLSPTFRALWARIKDGAIGRVHAARGLFGGSGFSWAPWLHEVDSGGIFGQVGAYHVKSLTSLLGPVAEVASSVETTVLSPRTIGGVTIEQPVPDLSVVTLRHESGALSSLVTSSVIQRYRRPAAIELYGTDGTANLLGEDWDPAGFELWRNKAGCWELFDAVDPTWSWCDGLRELVEALRSDRAPLTSVDQDLHILEIAETARRSAVERRPTQVHSRFTMLDLQPAMPS
jgi:predicted dehydrogenase